MIPHTWMNPDVAAPAWTMDSDVMETALYVAVMENPESLLMSSAHAASRTVLAPVIVCAHVSDVVVLPAPDADGPTASNPTAMAAPHGTVQVAYGGVARTSAQSGAPTELFPCAVEL